MGFSFSSFILKKDNTLWGCGSNRYGQLGLGDATARRYFTQITTNVDDIKEIKAGAQSTFMLKNNGTLWTCGYNGSGQLGLGDITNRNIFTKVNVNAENIKSIYCGYSHAFILEHDGTLWGCGWNEYGQLGLGDTTNRKIFTQVTINTDNIKSIFCGGHHAFILKNDGTLWGCGHNEYGELGLGDTNNRSTFTQVITNVDNIKEIFCGGYHTFILKNDGTLWVCGHNQYGQLGLGDTTNRKTFTQVTKNVDNIKEIYCGGAHSFILKNDNSLWGCGCDTDGRVGAGGGNNKTTFVNTLNDVKLVYVGNDFTFILKNDDTLWSTGRGEYYSLGTGSTSNRNNFAQVTVNADNVDRFPTDNSNAKTILETYDLNTGLVETLDTNNFRNIPLNKFEKIKVLCENPSNTHLSCLISFDKKQTWKMFDGNTWNIINDISTQNIIVSGMEVKELDKLDKNKLVSGGFTGDIDFRIAMKTNDVNKTPSITKIYIEYKK